MRTVAIRALAIILVLGAARAVMAQSAIAGVVKDSSGAVLPGVTVEASSPALIEKTKAGVTNEAGQYRIVDLRPGSYTVTFTLTGFNTVVREGILLQANFTAPVNAEMNVGAVTESVTVTGESPIVDVQTSQRRQVVAQELLESVPTGRNFVLMAGMTPGVTTGSFDVGGSSTMWVGGSLLVHGSAASDSRTMIDGLVVDAMFGNGQCSCVYDNEAQTQELAVQVSGGAAEYQLSGVIVNRIPKSGGNTFSGEALFQFSNGSMQSDNVDDHWPPVELPRRRDCPSNMMSTTAPAVRSSEIDCGSLRPDATGPITTMSRTPSMPTVARQGRQCADGVPCPAHMADLKQEPPDRNGRSGVQNPGTLSPRAECVPGGDGKPGTTRRDDLASQVDIDDHAAPAARSRRQSNSTQRRVLVSAGGHCRQLPHGICSRPSGTGYGSVSHVDTLLGTTKVAPAAGTGSGAGPNERPAMSQVFVASLSYVSGAHAFKVGIQDRFGWLKDVRTGVNGDLNQLYRSGAPFAVQVLNTPSYSEGDVNADLGVYVQDTWTRKRFTLSPGVRWDYFNGSLPEQVAAAGRFVPDRRFPAQDNLPKWNNVFPRLGGRTI